MDRRAGLRLHLLYMTETWDVLVAGSGPAGLMAAIAAARAGAATLLLEKKPQPGRKLLVSGSGRCNLSHGGELPDFLDRYGPAGRFLKPALHAFSNEDARAFFEERGLAIIEEEGGKLFPASGRAGEVLAVLLGEAREAGVELRVSSALVSLEPGPDGEGFLAQVGLAGPGAPGGPAAPQARAIRARKVILALGGASYPVTGSDGKGYAIPKALGQPMVAAAPALAPLLVTAFPVGLLAGASLRDRALRVLRGGRTVAKGRGDVLFTHRGLSGPGVLDLSRSVLPGDELGIQVCLMDEGEIDGLLLAGARDHGKRLVRSLVGAEALGGADEAGGAVPARLLDLLVELRAGDREARASSLSREARKALASSLAELRLPVAGLGAWDEAMVTRGGVGLDGVNPKTMESRIVPGLYFAGEFLDVDGDTGGYNIQAAFSTGALAGASAARSAAEARKA
jgi:predicted Rossmann fold flavoprotein